MADENLGLETKNEPSNEVNKGAAEPEKTTELGGSLVEKQPTASWMSQLPKELKEDTSLKDFRTIGDLAKAYLKEKATPKAEANSEGGTLDKILGNNEKEWQEFKKEFVKEGEDGAGFDEYIKFAKDSTLSPKQAKALLETSQKYNEAQKQAVQKQKEEASEKCKAFLKEQWGDGYEKGEQDAKKGFEKILGDDEFSKAFKKKYENDPFAIEMLRRVGEKLEDSKPKDAFIKSGQSQESVDPYGIPSWIKNKQRR